MFEVITSPSCNKESKEIKLTRGMVAVVDADDYEWISAYSWQAHKGKSGNYYARGFLLGSKNKNVYMHRLIAKATRGVQVDHKDRDGLNNRRSNLRLCSPAQNSGNKVSKNKTGFKGVSKMNDYDRPKPFKAEIRWSNRRKTIGYYETAEQAGRAYDEVAKEKFGEFALLNFRDERTGEPILEVVKEQA